MLNKRGFTVRIHQDFTTKPERIPQIEKQYNKSQRQYTTKHLLLSQRQLRKPSYPLIKNASDLLFKNLIRFYMGNRQATVAKTAGYLYHFPTSVSFPVSSPLA